MILGVGAVILLGLSVAVAAIKSLQRYQKENMTYQLIISKTCQRGKHNAKCQNPKCVCPCHKNGT